MKSIIGGALFAFLCAGAAAADIALDPDEERYYAAQTLQREGIACGDVTALNRYTGAEADRLYAQGYRRMNVATCANGARVLMAYGPQIRRRNPANRLREVAPIIRVLSVGAR